MSEELPSMALTIRQPWAWAIINVGKDIENRDWPTRFRGPVAIHAAKSMTQREYDDCMDFISSAFPLDKDDDMRRRARFVNGGDLRGGIIGVADVADCVEASWSPWFFGRYGFVLRNVRPVNFVPVRGALGFFDWRSQLMARRA